MPYIDADSRAAVDAELAELLKDIPVYDAGELNYLITMIVKTWIGSRPRYLAFNSAMGVLACVTQELYRRMVAPYEDTKREQNGDVF